MKRGTVFKIAGGLLCVLALVGAWQWRGNPDALWHIVSQQCVPHQQQQHAEQSRQPAGSTQGTISAHRVFSIKVKRFEPQGPFRSCSGS